MRQPITCAVSLVVVALLVPAPAGAQARQGSTLKNIKVLTDLSDEQIREAMSYIRGSLGVDCEHCHDRDDWSRDDKEAKRTARRMIRMVRALNRDQFDGELAVSCYSCHRGQLRPRTAVPLLTERPAMSLSDVTKTLASRAIGVDTVMARYLQVAGGAAAWSRLTSRVMTGRLVTSEPAAYEAEVIARAPRQFRSRILVNGIPFTRTFDGDHGWSVDNNGVTGVTGEALARLRRQATFALPVDLPQLYPRLSVEGESIVGGQSAFVLTAPGGRDRLFFSTRSGLLLRIESDTGTPLGVLPRRWDYEDYRKVDGVRLPFKVRETDPDYTYLWEFTRVRQNVSVDEALFRR
jgi:hypothetical protein